jgi:hypothetical protein
MACPLVSMARSRSYQWPLDADLCFVHAPAEPYGSLAGMKGLLHLRTLCHDPPVDRRVIDRHLAWHRHVTGRSTILRKSYAAVYRLGHLPRGRSIWSAADLQVLPPVCMISYTVPHLDGGAQSLTAAFRPSEPDDSGLRASSLTPIRYTHITLIRRGRKRLKLALVTIVTANLEQLCTFYQPWQLCRISPGSRYPRLVAPVRMFGLRDHAHAKRG